MKEIEFSRQGSSATLTSALCGSSRCGCAVLLSSTAVASVSEAVEAAITTADSLACLVPVHTPFPPDTVAKMYRLGRRSLAPALKAFRVCVYVSIQG